MPASRLLGAGIGAVHEQGCQRLFPGARLKTPHLRTKRWGITAAFHPFFPPPKSFPAKKKHIIASPLSAQGVLLQRPQAFHDKQAQEDPSAQSSYVAESDLEWELGRDPAGLLLPPQARQRLLNPPWAAEPRGSPSSAGSPWVCGAGCSLRSSARLRGEPQQEQPREAARKCHGR